jgi:hypothetical protein
MTDLFLLEFDHIDPSKKKVQITRSCPEAWISEKDNLELRCGRCHRIKTEIDRTYSYENNRNKKCKKDKKEFVLQIKQLVGKCQVCHWTNPKSNHLCTSLDFDHVSGEKYKQISNLYFNKKEIIAEEIAKTRLICRNCHELYTCIEKGGKVLPFYYSDKEIEQFKKILCSETDKLKCQNELKEILVNLGYL